MINQFEDIQRLGQTNVDTAMRLMGDAGKTWQAIAAEMNDYAKKSLQDGTATMEKMMAAQSFEQAVEIQTAYARRAYESYLQQMNKLGGMYASLAKDAYKPVERLLAR